MGCTIGTLNYLKSQQPNDEDQYGAGSTKNILMREQQHRAMPFLPSPNKRQRLKVQSEDEDTYKNLNGGNGRRFSRGSVERSELLCQYIPEQYTAGRSNLQSPIKKSHHKNEFSEPKRRSNKRKLSKAEYEFHPSLYTLPKAQMITLADFD